MSSHRGSVPTRRRLLSLGLVAVVVVLAVGAAVGLLSAGGPTPSPAPTRVSLSVLPPVAQPGAAPAPAAGASPVVTARVQPAVAGGTVVLERSVRGGWSEVARATQDRAGRVTFADVPPSTRGTAVPRFRAVALRGDGSGSRPSTAVDGSGWRVDFEDEFDGTELDPSRWAPRAVGVYNPEGSRQCSVSDEAAIQVGDGTLDLQVLLDPERLGERCVTPDDGTHDYYLNGHVGTEGIYAFRYGVAAARVKFQQPRGQHGAFWLQRPGSITPVPGDPEQSGAEIDVAEFFGEDYPQGGLASFLYYLDDSSENVKVGGMQPQATRQLPAGDTWWGRYHVFSVEWTPERYVVRVDGRQIFTTEEGVSGVDQFLVLSLLSSDWELGRLDPDSLPSTMSVDWVKVWQRSS